MSKTYRFKKKDHYLIRENNILIEYECIIGSRVKKVNVEPNSIKGKKLLAKFHSDSKFWVYQWKGPNWFHNMYA